MAVGPVKTLKINALRLMPIDIITTVKNHALRKNFALSFKSRNIKEVAISTAIIIDIKEVCGSISGGSIPYGSFSSE
ncbi:unnamed protein product [marine sediment metagenome]|uniref:Uncharacterized protein n=1 Tax=marine sediment metagenome TaxID=412755 RepID=X0WDC1_9ZZZZ